MHSHKFLQSPCCVVLESDCLFNKLRAPGEAHLGEVISLLHAAESVFASEFVSPPEFHILDSPSVFGGVEGFPPGEIEGLFLGCRI